VPLFGHLRAPCTEPVARAALDRILRDEVRHRDFGWDLLDWLVTVIDGAVELVRTELPDMLAELHHSYGTGNPTVATDCRRHDRERARVGPSHRPGSMRRSSRKPSRKTTVPGFWRVVSSSRCDPPGVAAVVCVCACTASDPYAVQTFKFGPFHAPAGTGSHRPVRADHACTTPRISTSTRSSSPPARGSSLELVRRTRGDLRGPGRRIHVRRSRLRNQAVAAARGGVIFAQSTQAVHDVQAFPDGVAVRVPAMVQAGRSAPPARRDGRPADDHADDRTHGRSHSTR